MRSATSNTFFELENLRDGKIRLTIDEWDYDPWYGCETFLLTIDELQTLYELIGGYLVQHTNLLDQEAV